jgi:hypothetical protein
VPGPDQLGERGAETWAAITEGRQSDALWQALVLEACRIVDRLDQLNDIIAGKGVLQLMHLRRMDRDLSAETVKIVMTVDAVLTEAREQAGQLRQLVSQLKLGQAVAAPTVTERSALDDLESRRRARRSPAAG